MSRRPDTLSLLLFSTGPQLSLPTNQLLTLSQPYLTTSASYHHSYAVPTLDVHLPPAAIGPLCLSPRFFMSQPVRSFVTLAPRSHVHLTSVFFSSGLFFRTTATSSDPTHVSCLPEDSKQHTPIFLLRHSWLFSFHIPITAPFNFLFGLVTSVHSSSLR